MSFLLPSDLGRLIYGYLQTSCSEQLAEEFLNTSDSMKECRKYRHVGFDSRVHDRTLTQMLNEYSLLTDLIFENCPESDRSHLNVVNKLQNLLKSRSQSTEVRTPVDAVPPRAAAVEAGCSPEEPDTNSFTQILNNTLNVFQKKSPTPKVQSPSQCSKSSPLKNTTPVNCITTVTSNREILNVCGTPSKSTPPITPIYDLTNDDHLDEMPISNATMCSELSSPFTSTPIFGIARSTPTLEKVTSAGVSSPGKLTKKPDSVISNTYSPRLVLPVSNSVFLTKSVPHSAPVQNLPHHDMEVDVVNTSLNTTVFNVPTVPTIPVKSNTIKERKSLGKLETSTKRRIEDRSSEPRIETHSVPLINHKDNLSERNLVRISPEQHKIAKLASSESCAKNLNAGSSPSVAKPSKALVKILPKLPSSQVKCSIKYPPVNAKDSIFARPPCPGPMPWDYTLRQPLTDGTESSDICNDHSKKKECKKNKTKKDRDQDKDRDVAAKNSKTECNKRKHPKKQIVCKKQKKLEEARRRNETKKENVVEESVDQSKQVPEKSDDQLKRIPEKNDDQSKRVPEKRVDQSKRVPEKSAKLSEIILDSNVDITKQVAKKILEGPTSGGICQSNNIVPTSSAPETIANNNSNNNCDPHAGANSDYDLRGEDDILKCQKISEEFVLFNKVSLDSTVTEC